MPFGLRVSNHEKNTRLYREFFANLCAFLKPGGYAFLFTQEKKLFDACLAAHPALTPLGSLRLHTGGLYPNFYLLQKK